MPELPEVETTKTSLLPLIGQQVQHVNVRQPSLRWAVPDNLTQLTGQVLQRLERRAKYILAYFEQDALLIHLGMSGSLRTGHGHTADDVRKHDHILIDMTQDQLRYHDPRRFGCMLWLDDDTQHKLLSHLAPEPLSDAFHADYLYQQLQRKNTAIKVCLMDQRLVVGVGNIYAAETLFRCGIHPARPANSLTPAAIMQLVGTIKEILQQAINLGGSSLKDYVNAQGENGYFQQTLSVYGRAGQPCVTCQRPLLQINLGQRASVFCEHCQR